ncbi:MAG: hypothetical protein K0R82_375 [Flavipsychrobacter sp.]|nr:hypothetical protein [Flavipsychrobacter sp.]
MNQALNHKEIVAHSFSPLVAGLCCLLGIGATYSNGVISMLWLAIVAITLVGFAKGRTEWIWYCIAASPVLEVWARMTRAPMLPYELGKYYLLVAIGLLLLLRARSRNGHSLHTFGYWIVGAIVPSLVVNAVVFDIDQWVFNLLGIAELAVLLILISYERWSIERFCRTLQYSVVAIVPVIVYLMLSASDFSTTTFHLGANSVASGGFASNQVSTIIGASIVALIILQVLKRPLFSFNILNFVLLGLLIFRGFLTFSRGGMIVAAIAAFVALAPGIFASARSFWRFSLTAGAVALVSVFVFQKVNSLTGNLLLMRYKGETYSTMQGLYKKDLNSILSGRSDIAIADVLIFSDNPVFGVGPGISKTLRSKYGYENIAAHTEFTRLLSEHGLGGFIVVMVLMIFPIWWLSKQKIAAWRGVVASLFALAIFTTFHAAMRTNTTIVVYALAAVPVFYYTNKKANHSEEDIIYRQ